MGKPVAVVFWDLENCQVPASQRGAGGHQPVAPERVVSHVRDLAIRHGRIVGINAYFDPHGTSKGMRLSLQQAGVKLMDIPNHRKEAVDKALIVDLCMFAVDYEVRVWPMPRSCSCPMPSLV